jgi:hypothetical protein
LVDLTSFGGVLNSKIKDNVTHFLRKKLLSCLKFVSLASRGREKNTEAAWSFNFSPGALLIPKLAFYRFTNLGKLLESGSGKSQLTAFLVLFLNKENPSFAVKSLYPAEKCQKVIRSKETAG